METAFILIQGNHAGPGIVGGAGLTDSRPKVKGAVSVADGGIASEYDRKLQTGLKPGFKSEWLSDPGVHQVQTQPRLQLCRFQTPAQNRLVLGFLA